MIDSLSGLDGVRVFVDDILVFGQGETFEEAVQDHDRKINELFKRLEKLNIKLNPEKI